MKSFKSSEAGFSLVELAIALVIIGLLVGGVLKGVELIESARLKSVLMQVNEFRVATSSFLDRYGALPGDYHEASIYIKEGLVDGNNSGAIEGDGLDPGSEALAFWSHLGEAKLIATPGKPSQERASFGSGAPAAKIGGGFTIVHNPADDMPGHWFCLGEQNGSKNDKGGLTPLQALSIDKKADNGDPNSGKIRAKTGWGEAPAACITDKGKYNIKETRKVCALYFQL